jgi:hypothetical protein
MNGLFGSQQSDSGTKLTMAENLRSKSNLLAGRWFVIARVWELLSVSIYRVTQPGFGLRVFDYLTRIRSERSVRATDREPRFSSSFYQITL